MFNRASSNGITKLVFNIEGGGAYIDSSSLLIEDSHVEQNEAVGNGGGSFIVSLSVELNNVLVAGNAAANGGGIYQVICALLS